MNALSYPPHRLYSARELTQEETLDKLNNYISLSSSKAYLLPNAILTKDGPKPNSGSAAGGLVMHNLQRVARGLGGENMGGTGEDRETIGKDGKKKRRRRGEAETNGGLEVGMDERPRRVDGNEGDEVDVRADEDMHFVAEGQEAEDAMEVEEHSLSKEERKRLKKERRKVEKKDREEKRRKKD